MGGSCAATAAPAVSGPAILLCSAPWKLPAMRPFCCPACHPPLLQLEPEAAEADAAGARGNTDGAVLGRLAAARAFLSPSFEQVGLRVGRGGHGAWGDTVAQPCLPHAETCMQQYTSFAHPCAAVSRAPARGAPLRRCQVPWPGGGGHQQRRRLRAAAGGGGAARRQAGAAAGQARREGALPIAHATDAASVAHRAGLCDHPRLMSLPPSLTPSIAGW